MTEFPDDADGSVLADLAKHGVDLTKPLLIEFVVDVPSEKAANKVAAAMKSAGYDPKIEYDAGEPDEEIDEDDDEEDEDEFGASWTVYAKVNMVPKYEEILRIQDELDQLAEPHGGQADGWGVLLGSDE